MGLPISFAGIALSWTESYARDYCAKLNEMGFCAKTFGPLVAYSHRPFSRAEAEQSLAELEGEAPDASE